MKRISFCLVAVALLGCLSAQKPWVPTYQRPEPPQAPTYPRPELPQVPKYPRPELPQVPKYPRPELPQVPKYPRPELPQAPTNPHPEPLPKAPTKPLPQQPEAPKYPRPQQPEAPTYPRPQQPEAPKYPRPQQPEAPKYPRPQQPEAPTYPRPQQPEAPKYPRPQQPEAPKYPRPQQPQAPKYPLPKQPETPKYIPIQKIPLKPQQPQQPQQPKQPSKHTPATEPYHSCEVADQYKIRCGHEGFSATECDALNCCFDGRTCYFGKAVTVQCTKDGQIIVVLAKDATLPNIDLDKLSLLAQGPNCIPVDSNSEFVIYQFTVRDCGTELMEAPGVLTYQNKLVSQSELLVGHNGAITRDSRFELLFQCRYIGTGIENLVIEVGLVPPPESVAALGPMNVELVLANGHCAGAKGCVEAEVAYSSFYTDADYPVIKVLRDAVYVDVRLMDRTDHHLHLTIGRCWATSDPNPHSSPQWELLNDGCPFTEDNYMTTMVPRGPPSEDVSCPTHHVRFIFKMFTFVDQTSMIPQRGKVYIHCNTAVCQPTARDNCEPRCFRHMQRRDISRDIQRRTDEMLVSSGAIIYVAQ